MPATFDWILAALGSTVLTSAAVVVIVKTLVKPIWAALNSYSSGYAQQKASIDARFSQIEKLIEEQKQIARAVETIKHELAAEAKGRDNRWEFRKEIYVNLVTSITDCTAALGRLHEIKTLFPEGTQSANALWQGRMDEYHAVFKTASASFVRYLHLAPLAATHKVRRILTELDRQLPPLFSLNPQHAVSLDVLRLFNDARDAIEVAAYDDLWGTPGSSTEPTTH
ncbi:MAG TPA: hypothetical protein VN736_06020 [Candidatus Limnocylindrales bacterium]|nr:hypothetical protein [Candidatus Limnocylindrales bacterium]